MSDARPKFVAGQSRPASATDVLRFTPAQARFYLSEARFNVAACGRRSGKTAIAKRRGVERALCWTGVPARFIFGAPVQHQAQSIFWRDVKSMVPAWARASDPREGNMTIELLNGATVQVMGFDKPERAEGSPVAHVALDEFANMAPTVWEDHVRPMLTDTQGTADIFGVPEGRNHYWETWVKALDNASGEWAAHHWRTVDVLPMYLGEAVARREIELARADMDAMTFQQEYEASFNNIEGRVYHEFSRETHARESLPYDPRAALVLCFDFNVAPGVCVVCQEREYRGSDPEVASQVTCVVGEVHIPRDSNTPTVVRRLVADYFSGDQSIVADHRGDVFIYGDPSGGNRSTKSEAGSDWDVIRAMLKRVVGGRLRDRVKRDSPPQRTLVNALNARFRTADGVKHLLVCPRRAPRTVEDLEVTTVKEGTAGEIDKDKDDGRYSHLSDALSYFVEAAHPMRGTNRSDNRSAV